MREEPLCSPADLPLRRRTFQGFLAATAFAAILAGWGGYAELSSAVLAQARFGETSDRKPIQHMEGGIVSTIFVHEGERVHKGDPLLRLDGEDLRADRDTTAASLAEFSARIDRLKSEEAGLEAPRFRAALLETARSDPETRSVLNAQRDLFRSRQKTFEDKSAQLLSQKAQLLQRIVGAESQLAGLRKVSRITQDDIGRTRKLLDKGLVQISRLSALETSLAQTNAQLGQIKASAEEARQKIEETNKELEALGSSRLDEIRTDLSDLALKEMASEQKLAALDARMKRLLIQSPADGVVHRLAAFSEGQVIRAAEPILYIAPLGQDLRLVARVKPEDMDHVHEGQEASLSFSTFRSRNLPSVAATVARIAPDLTTDEKTGAAWYEVDLSLTPEGQRALNGLELLPGMPAEAHISTGARSPFAYLFEPLKRAMKRAMIEPAAGA